MNKTRWMIVAGLACAALAMAGCSLDPGKAVMSNPTLQAKVMDMIAADHATATAMSDRLVASDTARTIVVQRLAAHPAGARQVMELVARDRTLMDGALTEAMKDPAMRDHVITLFKGMQMAGAK